MAKRQLAFFIKQWLVKHWIFLVGMLLFFGLIGGMSALFRVERALVSYTSLLLLAIGVVVVAIDMMKEWANYMRAARRDKIVNGTAIELLLQERLVEAEKVLRERRDQERERQGECQDYYTLWAHQMKIPIAAGQLLVADLPTSKEKQALERELFKIEQYTGLVLNYLRLQSFQEDLLVQRESLDVLVRQVVKKFSIFFIQQQIELRLEELNRMIVTDQKWFSLLLEQFISNAIKYTTSGQIRIYLDGSELVIQDTGIGIATSDLEWIFARGFSGYNVRISQQSSGLGLYLAQRIGEKLGVTFSLSSKVGQGTQVRICLEKERLMLE